MARKTPLTGVRLDVAIRVVKHAAVVRGVFLDDAVAQVIAQFAADERFTIATWLVIDDCREFGRPINFVNVKDILLDD